MRLLTVKEVKKQDLKDTVRESIYLNKVLKEQQQDWNKLKESFDPERQKLEKDFLSFSKGIQEKRGILLKEVSDLEVRKQEALEPLDQRWYELEVKQADLENREQGINKLKIQLEDEKHDLVDKISDLEDKKQELSIRESAIKSMEESVIHEKSLSKITLEDLNTKWIEYHSKYREVLSREIDLATVKDLEARKQKALEPLLEQEQALLIQQDKVLKETNYLEDQKEELQVKQTEFKKDAEFIYLKSQELAIREIGIASLEEKITRQIKLQDKLQIELDEKWKEFENTIGQENEAARTELRILEDRKQEALKPLDELKVSLEIKEQELYAQKQQNITKAQNIETILAENKQASASLLEKEADLKQQEQSLLQDIANLNNKELDLEKEKQQLQKEVTDFNAKVAQKELELLEHERRNFDKEQLIEVIKSSLEKERQDLNKYKIQLDDRQQVLEQSWQELREKSNG